MKSKFCISVLGLACALALAGCATEPVAPLQAQRMSATFTSSRDRVWPLLVSEVGLLYPVRVIEKESGLISTDWVTLPAGFNNMNAQQWIFRPGGFLATWNGLRMNMKVMVAEAEPGRVLVTINCHYEAFEDNVQKTWLVMESNGTIENAILAKIEKQLMTAPVEQPKAVLPPAVPAVKSAADGLIELKKLLDAGAITPAEYEAKKKTLLEKL